MIWTSRYQNLKNDILTDGQIFSIIIVLLEMQASFSDKSDRRMVKAPAFNDGADITNDVFEIYWTSGLIT